MIFQRFLEILEFNSWHFWKVIEIHNIKNVIKSLVLTWNEPKSFSSANFLERIWKRNFKELSKIVTGSIFQVSNIIKEDYPEDGRNRWYKASENSSVKDISAEEEDIQQKTATIHITDLSKRAKSFMKRFAILTFKVNHI